MLSDITSPDCLFRSYVKGIVVFASIVDIELVKSFLSSVTEDVQNILAGNYNT